jgi:CRISPR-associated endonuclease/helicase Cas3
MTGTDRDSDRNTKYYAHSENDRDEKHGLLKHLQETARLAESFACQESCKSIFYATGLLHDLGKYQIAFQNYLENGGKRGSVPHASWGAGYARRNGMFETSIVVDGHHKGMPDSAAWKSDTEPFKRGDIVEFEDVVKAFENDIGLDHDSIKKEKPPVFIEPLQREAFIRYLFSALTDSDWLSTEKHFDQSISEMRVSATLPVDEMMGKLEEVFSYKSKEGEINQLRNEARYQALQKAAMPCGFYSLALPTGMGKTLTSLAWALKHAKKNTLKRIIIVLPYISIIDQTAQVLKGIFGEEWVLEHHSSYNEDEVRIGGGEEGYSPIEQRKKLACENWGYPVIVTTTVQFFESLFSNRPSRCRKIHNIAESVVIFDEVQTLPKEVILPTLQMLKNIQSVMRTSFLFCTATQPAFEKRQGFDGIDAIYPLIENPAELYKATRRVKYHLLNDLASVDSTTLLKAAMGEAAATLVIFNTKKAALEFYNYAKGNNSWGKKYHLSTSMCPSHRKEVIENIRADLSAERKILVSSTQLIEAGVDFDFPVVFRAMAPLEALIQAAGRCNRENKLGESGGKVFLFKLEDGGMPDKTYAACAGHAEEFVKLDIDQLHDHKVFEKYYSQVVQLYVDPDRYKINEARGYITKQPNFQTVNDSYHIIAGVTEGLFIYLYNDESIRLFHSIEHKEFLSRDDYRRMQMFTVQVYKHFTIQNADMCKLMPQGFMVWYGNYDRETGISVMPIEADKLVV